MALKYRQICGQELSRTEAGRIALDIRPLRPEAIVNPVVERMQPQFADKSIRLTINLSPDLPEVSADCDRSIQIFTNLSYEFLLPIEMFKFSDEFL